MIMKLYRGLLVSCGRNLERATASEIVYALQTKLDLNQRGVYARLTGISGLVTVKIPKSISVLNVVEELRKLDEEGPFFIHALKIKPIDTVINADLELMKDTIPKLIMDMVGTYRISPQKRHTSFSTSVIIEAAASVIPNKVDLTNYDWELLIEVVGRHMGLTAAPRGYVFSTHKALSQTEQTDWFLPEDD